MALHTPETGIRFTVFWLFWNLAHSTLAEGIPQISGFSDLITQFLLQYGHLSGNLF